MRKITLNEIKTMAAEAKGKVNTLYLHWSAGRYGQFFTDYHLNIDADGSVYTDSYSFTELLNHTWHRNTGAIGIALACCYNAIPGDLGEYPPTKAQLETLAQVIAIICRELGLPVDYDHVKTHCEAAEEDGYGPSTVCERWDLMGMGDDIRALAAKF